MIEDEKGWSRSPLAGTDCILTGHVLGHGKGMPKDKRPPAHLPGFVIENLLAFAAGKPLINLIPAAVYDLKT